MKAIPYGRQSITQNDIDAVVETLHHDYLTTGPKVGEFESKFAQYVGARYAVAVSNGTGALHLSAIALGVNKSSKVITTPITFVASANCIKYCGGDVDFADINAETYLIDIEKIRAKLEASPRGTYEGIIPVDFAGRAVNLEELRKLADEFNLWIIEDACHAPGGYFKDSKGEKQKCGNGKFADLSVFSFHPVKHIACGEGGMITTDNEVLYNRLLSLRSHGMIYQGDDKLIENHGKWYMEMQSLGYNYRLPDINCALGISQLSRADVGLVKRRKIAKKYYNSFKGLEFIYGQTGVIEGHAYHLYVIEVKDRLGLYNFLREHKIYAQIHYIPCHLMPYYKQFGWKEGDMPLAEAYYQNCISLPMYPSLTQEEQEFVISKINEFYA